MMDVLLTHAYFLEEDPHERAVMKPYPPLGVLYVASHLEACGFGVRVFDSTFSTRAQLAALIESERPPVVGIYVNLITRASALDLVRRAKAAGAIVVLGGPEPASYAERYLAHGADVVVVGEGELTMAALLRHFRDRGLDGLETIDGIRFRGADGATVATPPRPPIRDLDAQPWPARGAIDLARYVETWRRHHGRGSLSLITARGCPYECQWCSHAVFGHSHRRRSVGNVADELESLVATYRPDMVWYADDVFTIHRRWLLDYAEELDRRRLRVPFETITREDRLDDEVVAALARMGCWRLWIGAESGSQRVLDAMKRRTDAARVREMVALLRRHGIESGLFVMLGYEGEELADIEATVDHLRSARPDVFLTTGAYPIAGTPYHQSVRDRLIARTPWEAVSDRDLSIAGRLSKRYYGFATRWMVHELERAREGDKRFPSRLRMSRHALQSRLGRIGMWLTRGEVESGAPADWGAGA